ncbi:MAG: hypothetical protein ABJB12_23630, partial [Pseudomonadota bacterium]
LDAKLMRAVTGDTTRPGWHLLQCGSRNRPITVKLSLLGHGPIRLRFVERVDGLPAHSGDPATARSQAAPGPAQDSDVSLLSRAIEL